MRYIFLIKMCSFLILVPLILINLTCSEKKITNSEEDNILTISPDGGEYTFPDGIILRVPAGAVTEETDVLLHKINSTKLQTIYDKRGVSIDNLLACIEGGPDGLTFNLPVQIILTVNLEPGEIPIVHEVNWDSSSYSLITTEIFCDPGQDTLVISLNHFSSISAEIAKEYDDLYGECTNNPCRCGRIKVEQQDKDFICNNGDCQVTETKVNVTFLDCEGAPTEESFFREVSAGCSSELYLTMSSSVVVTGNQAQVSTSIQLGCEPTEGQSVDFSLSNPGLATVNPTYSTTNADGNAYTLFQAGEEEGTVTVTARSTISYYTYTISANAGGQRETVNGPLITTEKSQSVDIEIQKPVESWSGTVVMDFYSDFVIQEYSNYNINFQFYAIPLSPESEFKDFQGTATATQDVDLEIGHECWTYQNLNAPSTLDLIVGGFVSSDTGDIYLTFERTVNDAPFYQYETCFVCDPENPDECDETSLIHMLMINNSVLEDNDIPLAEGTYSGSYDVLYTTYTYTLTLHQDELPSSQVALQKKYFDPDIEIEDANNLKSEIE